MVFMNDTPKQRQTAFINWFRDSSPYIHAHRHCTFVISVPGEAVLAKNFAGHVHDFALLSSLGIRLVLVHGIRPQIDQRLTELKQTPRFHQNLRITDDTALHCVTEAAGKVRVELEALLSMGLSNSPMSGAKIRVASGNFITAKPIGIINGIDYHHTGTVRRIDSSAIHQQLDQNYVVLISPVGFSPSGEIFNLSAEQLATEVAIALQAEKLILMTERSCRSPDQQQLIPQMTTQEATELMAQHPELPASITHPLKAAIKGCQSGVERGHLVDSSLNGALLLELFSRDGIGTLISCAPFEELRKARLNDIGGILELITPLEQQGKLITRSREHLEMAIDDYVIIERDGLIIACTALHKHDKCGELACLAVHKDYRNAARGNRLLEQICRNARTQGINKIFVLSTQTMHWFIEHNFTETSIESLPQPLKKLYNRERNSRVLCKNIC